MGREGNQPIRTEAIERYLTRIGFVAPRVVSLEPIGQSTQEELKDYGYGRPLRVLVRSESGAHALVLRTMSPDPFGHERRADRADAHILSFDTFNSLPHHIRALYLGAFDERDEMWPIPAGEFFLVTDFVDGDLYAQLLRSAARQDEASELDLTRARALATYLAEVHRERRVPETYLRHLRDTVGSGEGIFGLCDSYPADHPIATPSRLEAIERRAVEWRWRLKRMGHRARATHGDFHPFNILFRRGADFTVLDRSRGGVGDPADDVICLSINYLFFALQERDSFTGAARVLWNEFYARYLQLSDDHELFDVAPLYVAWRTLVLASPLWYPNLRAGTRERLLRLAERLLEGAPFRPEGIEEVLA